MKTRDIRDISLSVVIPVYGGEKTVGKLVDTLVELLPAKSLQIVLVYDCSPDNSHAVCLEAQQRHPSVVTYLQLAKNFGEHNAVLAGLNHATGEYVVTMDDDFQNPPEEVEKLVNTALAGDHDVVYVTYRVKRDSWFRNLGSRFNDFMARFLLDKPKDLYMSSFRCLNRFLVKEIIKYTGPYPYIDGLILRATRNIGQVEAEHHERNEGESGYTLRKLLSLWLNMFVNFSVMPLRISMVVGLCFSILGLVLAVYSVIEKILVPGLPAGYPTLLVAITVFSGIILIMLGLVGEYLGRMYLTANQSPQFTIRRVVSSHTPDENTSD